MNRVGVVGLVAFLLLDAMLVALAWRHSQGDAEAATIPALPSARSPAGAGTSETAPGSKAPDQEYVAALADGRLVVRAPVRDCADSDDAPPLRVATSSDGGSTFTTTQIEGLATVSGAFAGDGRARVFGADAECSSVTYETSDGGGSWQLLDEPPSFWSVLPGAAHEVMTPTDTATVPCRPRRVSGIDAGVARVWCADGEILGTSSAGAEWVTLGRLEDALTVAFSSPATGYALAEDPDCEGLSVLETNDGGTTWQGVHCSPVHGPAAIAADGDSVAVVGADRVDASPDAGQSWTLR